MQHFVGAATFARADAYQRQGRVTDTRWSSDRTILTGHVRGAARLPYSARVRMRLAEHGPEPVTGLCDCPVGERCKHVGALLLEAVRTPAPTARGDVGATWRRALDPILEGLDPRGGTAPLGLWFELQPGRPQGPRRPPEPTVAVRPVQLGPGGRWRRTGISWRDFAQVTALHDYDDRQARLLRELHLLLTDGAAPLATGTWLPLDRARSAALWTLLDDAQHERIGLVTGGKAQTPLLLAAHLATPAIDVGRDADGLVLKPLVADGDPRTAPPVAAPFVLIGEPATGLATWHREDGAALTEAVVGLARFAEPVAPPARAFLGLDDPIRVPRAEEGAFLTEHYRRLATLLPVVSRDGSFAPPALPVPVLGLTLRFAAAKPVEGTWWWRYRVPGEDVTVERSPFDPDGTHGFRDVGAERRLLDGVAAAGVTPELAPDLFVPGSSRLKASFGFAGTAAIEFAREVLPRIRRIDGLLLEERGKPVDYRPAESAPVVTIATSERAGDRDWFDLDIDVRVGDDAVPIADVIRALARGDDFMVLPGGVYFPLDSDAFGRLRDLLAEARELADDGAGGLRISRYQGSLWEELAALGIVQRQAESWRRAVAGLAGSAEGTLPPQALPPGFPAQLRPYQQTGYDWLAFLYDSALGGVLADDMGLGKTVQSLALVARAVADGRLPGGGTGRPRFLVIAPTSVVPNWTAEAVRFAPGVRVTAITETTRRSGRPLRETVGDAELVITTYALFRLEAEAYGAIDWSGLLLDEAQFVKNRNAATHQAVRSIDVPFKLAITGTPMENSLMDLWSVFSIAAPGLFPSPTGFAEAYQRPIERDGDAERLAQLRRRIRPLMLRRTKQAVAADLPDKVEQVLEVELHPEQRAVYERLLARERQRVLGLLDEFGRNRFAIFRALTMLRQAALDAALVDPDLEDVPSTKLDLLEELLGDALEEGHRVLVFSQFTRLLGRVRARLDAADIGYAYLDGSTVRRDEAIDRFRSGAADVFLVSLKAGGFGLNLAEADYCILLDPWWNPAAEEQAIDRAHRIGQTRSVFVYRLVAKDTIEEKVMALKAAKAELFDAVMADAEGVAGAGISAEDVRALLA
ncbi:MAG: DEAD/DEAH box helicase [Amnibacterium sp.]